MPDYKKITDLDLVTTVSDDDLFIVETATGTKSVKIETFRDTEVTKESIGLGNVDNTSDLNKPISTATQTALNAKANTTDVASTYLSKTDAQNTYLTQNTATGTYLTRADASTTYLTQSSASSTYATQTALSTGLSGKANTATTIAGYGITDAYTKTEVDSKTTNTLVYKGAVATYDNLPSAGLTVGDLYTVNDTSAKYFWNGTTWQKMGDNIDISLYLSKSEASSTYLTQASASSTYATQASLSDYETSAHASSTYLSQATASTDYATKLELSGKQDNLTAGDNISISNGTISATNTTYTAGTGIDITGGVISNTQTSANWGNITGTLSNQTDLQTALNGKVAGNSAITGATKCKITYDSKGLVTSGADLLATDIPNLSLSKITDVTASASELNIMDGVTATTSDINSISSKIGLTNLSIDSGSTNYLSYDNTTGKFGAKVDTTAVSSSTKLITSGGVYNAINDIATRSYVASCPQLTPTNGVCTWSVTHNLGTQNLIATLYSNGNEIEKNVTLTSDNAISVAFKASETVTAGSYSLLIVAPSIYATLPETNKWVYIAKILWSNASLGGYSSSTGPTTYDIDLSDIIPARNAQYEVWGWMNHGLINIQMDSSERSDQGGAYCDKSGTNYKTNVRFIVNGTSPYLHVRSYVATTGVDFHVVLMRRVG